MTNLDIQSCTMMMMMMMMMMMIWTVSPAVVHHYSHHKYDPKVALQEINKKACDLKKLNSDLWVPYKHESEGICEGLYCLAEKALQSLNNTNSGELRNLTILLHHFNKNDTCGTEPDVQSSIKILLEDICNCSGRSNV